MSIIVTLSFPGYWEGRQRIIADDLVRVVQLRSPYLVSAGQTIEIGVAAQTVTMPQVEPGDRLIEGRMLRGPRDIKVEYTHDCGWVPSTRPLWEVLQDAAQHGIDFPTHGIDCVCMDKLSYELKHHILRALPERTGDTYINSKEWEDHFNARMRIKHVLRLASNIL
jgi:hypothetical protein